MPDRLVQRRRRSACIGYSGWVKEETGKKEVWRSPIIHVKVLANDVSEETFEGFRFAVLAHQDAHGDNRPAGSAT